MKGHERSCRDLILETLPGISLEKLRTTKSHIAPLYATIWSCDLPEPTRGGGSCYKLPGFGGRERGPPIWQTFLSPSAVLVFVDCTSQPFQSQPKFSATESKAFRFCVKHFSRPILADAGYRKMKNWAMRQAIHSTGRHLCLTFCSSVFPRQLPISVAACECWLTLQWPLHKRKDKRVIIILRHALHPRKRLGVKIIRMLSALSLMV